MYSSQDYSRDLKQLEQQFEQDKEALKKRLENAHIAINNEFLENADYHEGTTFNEFVDAMKQKLRIVIILNDHCILVLNDPTIPDGFRMNYSSGMVNFKLDENCMTWTERAPGYCHDQYEFYYDDGNFGVSLWKPQPARWFLTADTNILRNSPILIQKIEYPVDKS